METDVHRILDSEFQGNKAKKWCGRRASLTQGLLAILTSGLGPSDGYYLKSSLGFWGRSKRAICTEQRLLLGWLSPPKQSLIFSQLVALLVPVRSLHCPPSFGKYAHRVKVISFQELREVKGREGAWWSRNRHLCNVAAGETSENTAKFRRLWMLSPGICKENAGISLRSRSRCYWWCWVDSVHQ